MAVQFPSGSHIDTPAWQSFELRMRARAAARRAAKRRLRRRRLLYAAAAFGAFAVGMAWAIGLARLEEQQRVTESIVIEWPNLPGPPASAMPATMGALPLPADWAQAPAPEVTPLEYEETVEEPVATNGPPPPAAERPAATKPPAATERVAAKPAARELQPSVARAETRVASPPLPSRPREREIVWPPPRPIGSTGNASAERAPEPTARSERPAPVSVPPPDPDPVRLEATPTTAVVSRPAAPPPSASPPRVDPRDSIRGAIERYRSAYQRLDASAARAVWPTVDAGALGRAFGALASQELWFDRCAIDVAGGSAEATCAGQARVVPKFGGGSETARRTWQFKLRQSGSSWIIDRATVK